MAKEASHKSKDRLKEKRITKSCDKAFRMADADDPVLKAVRDNIDLWGFYYLKELGKLRDYDEKLIEKWLKECLKIPIRLFLAGKNDWENIGLIPQRQYKKTEPSKKELAENPYSRTDGLICYKGDNPDLPFDLIIMNRRRFVELIKLTGSQDNGLGAWLTYVYAVHHEVFHSYERYLEDEHKTRVSFIDPSKVIQTMRRDEGYEDEVVRSLVEEFMKDPLNRNLFYDWIKLFNS